MVSKFGECILFSENPIIKGEEIADDRLSIMVISYDENIVAIGSQDSSDPSSTD